MLCKFTKRDSLREDVSVKFICGLRCFFSFYFFTFAKFRLFFILIERLNMLKHSLLHKMAVMSIDALLLGVPANLVAQSFSFADSKSGFSYGTKDAACLLVTDSSNANILFSEKSKTISDLKIRKIRFTGVGDSITSDTSLVATSDFLLSADSLTVTIKDVNTNTGYLLTYGDSSCNIGSPCEAFVWVRDYQPIDSVSWDKDTVICSDLNLYISPVMTYRTMYGAVKKVERTMKVRYKSFLSNDGNPGEEEVSAEYEASSPISLDAFPYVDTPFEIEDVSSSLLKSVKIVTDTFYTQAVVAYPYFETAAAQEHEGDEGTDTLAYFSESITDALTKASTFRSSGPLTFNFVSNSNPMANHFEWAIASGENAQRGDFKSAFVLFEKEVNAYVVSEPNTYCIELSVTNIRNDSVCEHQSYSCFKIAESALYIPNTFTPNGDGTNDEFRVAYRSIKSFQIYIYDQWGRRVYESDDITQGWDGYVGSKLGTIGTYFYVIKAEGTDGVSYNKKGTINLVRSK